jgi:hypothetical protein
LIYTVYLSDTHDYTHLGVVRQATRLDGKNREIHQGVQSSSKTIATPANTKLDFFIT